MTSRKPGTNQAVLEKFQSFYEQIKARFFNYLLRLTGDGERAADAFQESFVRYWQRYGSDTLNVKLLYTIGRNLAVDGHRRRQRLQPIDDHHEDDRPSQESAMIVKESFQ